ncbi:MAG TPA: PQQ-dependent sugar dehydrogenase [Capillimicrobium sp.]|nr:PQQ-dependent sugar dehydrogenase [Capillimicrobium sp.]
MNRPTWVGAAPGDRGAVWVGEQPGRIVRIAPDGRRRVALDLTGTVRTGAEQGLLGIAFHPDFATNRRVFVHYTDRIGDTRVVEYRARRDGTIDPEPVRELLHVEQPEENHNGGQLAFGPDGKLYLGLGDGGGAFDPRQTAQDPEQLLGKIIRADVDGPQDGEPAWEVVLTGLRNPWRFSFDFALGEIWIGDVGQDEVEEVDRVLLEDDEPPKNLGWSAFEGTHVVPGDHRLDPGGELVWPVASYDHETGCSITGGVVYRGTDLPRLAGRYVYGDFCSGTLWSLEPTPEGRATDVRVEAAKLPQLTHIGTDEDGELLLASAAGTVQRAVPVSRRSATGR